MDAQKIFKKLHLNNEGRLLIINAPDEYLNLLSSTNFDRASKESNEGAYDFIQVFSTSLEELTSITKEVVNLGKYDCLFWLCYPKGTGKIKSDIKRDTIWEIFHSIEYRPVTQIAIDETWSAMRGRPKERVGK